MLRHIYRLASATLTLVLYRLSGLFSRQRTCWVFGNYNDVFEGNSKYLFLWVSRNAPSIQASWITGNVELRDLLVRQGYRCVLRRSPSGIWRRATAGCYVFNDWPADIGATLSRGALLVNLWHGSGLKTLGYGNRASALSQAAPRRRDLATRANLLGRTLIADVYVSTSPTMAQRFKQLFRLSDGQTPVIGTPRLDTDLRAAARRLDRSSTWDEERARAREIYVYMPTAREGSRPFLDRALPDLTRLSAALSSRGATLYIKLHPRTRETVPSTFPNIRAWPAGTDFYAVVDDVDCVITDYSSIMFDLLRDRDRGIVLYPFDVDEYLDERALYFPYAESVAGHRVDRFDALCTAIECGRAVQPLDPEQVKRVRERCWAGSVSPAAPAVYGYVCGQLGLA